MNVVIPILVKTEELVVKQEIRTYVNVHLVTLEIIVKQVSVYYTEHIPYNSVKLVSFDF